MSDELTQLLELVEPVVRAKLRALILQDMERSYDDGYADAMGYGDDNDLYD